MGKSGSVSSRLIVQLHFNHWMKIKKPAVVINAIQRLSSGVRMLSVSVFFCVCFSALTRRATTATATLWCSSTVFWPRSRSQRWVKMTSHAPSCFLGSNELTSTWCCVVRSPRTTSTSSTVPAETQARVRVRSTPESLLCSSHISCQAEWMMLKSLCTLINWNKLV